MMEDDVLVEAFLKGKLSEKARHAFLERLKRDAEFREKVTFEAEMHNFLNEESWHYIELPENEEVARYKENYQSHEVQQLKKVLEEQNAVYQQKHQSGRKRRLLIASAAILIVLLSLYWLLPNSNTDDLYTDYLNQTELPSFIDRGVQNSIDLAKAQRLFESREYEEALKILLLAQEQFDEQKSEVYQYISVAQMELNEFNAAEETIDQLVHSNLIDAPKGYWLRALLKLKQGELEECRAQLRYIVDNNLYNKKKASALLEELED